MNIFACLVHEAPECVHDLLDNLAYLDDESAVLLYDGSGGSLTARLDLRSRPEVMTVPSPKPMAWGKLHDFAIDSMRFAVEEMEFDTVTIVDSDQLLLRKGYSRLIQRFLAGHPDAGCLVSQPGPQPPATRMGPARAAWQEVDLWRPFLRRFPRGESTFPQWTFWPSTVFTQRAVRDLLALREDDELQEILGRSRIWASEEVILPSLVALAGHEVVRNPCSYDLVQYRQRFSPEQLKAAMGRDDVFWVHPVPRKIDDPLRALVRDRYRDYGAAISPAGPRRFPRTLDLINRMQSVEGWLSGPEADLLAAAAVRALSEIPAPHAIVEVGSYCGRATVVLGSVAQTVRPGSKVHTFDPHDGTQGERDRLVQGQRASHRRLLSNIERFGLADVVRPVVARSADVEWSDPISLLLIDRLHDYASVATDFAQFQDHLTLGGLVAFHDYADYFPGVRAWVDHLKTSGAYALVDQAESMVIMEKTRSLPLPPVAEIVEKAGAAGGLLGADEAALLFLAAARAFAECDHGEVVSTGNLDEWPASVLSVAASAAGRDGPSTDPDDVICLLTVGAGGDRPETAEVVELLNRVAVGGFAVFLDPPVRAGSSTAGRAVRSRLFEHACSYGRAVAIRRARAGRLGYPSPPSTRLVGRSRPLVSCVMPTYNRRRFVPQAILNWQAQDYPRCELVVIDDGEDSVEDLIPADARIQYVRLPTRKTIGAKRNLACEQSRGDFVVHWDDDDWSAPWRVGYQVEMLLKQDVEVSGLSTVYFCDISADRAWRYEYPAGRKPWVHDATFCYRRSQWESDPFPDSSLGLDTAYLWQGRPKRVGTLADPSFYVGMVHPANTSRKDVHDAWWHAHPVSEIASLMGPDWEAYQKA
jgi:Glycosyl transferase family 2/Methyltransferase domain